MSAKQQALFALLLVLAVWLPLSWPLPSMLDEAMPTAAMKREAVSLTPDYMLPGDHLQLLYHMWLFSDFVAGKTPWFHNLYEFNTGNDAERYRFGAYYLPYSLAFTAFNKVANRALAWNLTCLLALWVAAFATWRLCRRYTSSELVAATGTLLALLLPYQWVQLFGGSPAGFGMTLIPVLLLGVDRVVRDDRISGGWLAGGALLGASMTDQHSFFFGALLMPCWGLVALSQREAFAWPSPKAWFRLVRAGSPVLLMAGLAYALSAFGNRHIKSSHASGGRTIPEVALFSPKADGLWSWQELGVSSQIYLGYLATALLVVGLFLLLYAAWKQRTPAAWRRAILLALIAAGATGVVLLSMGPHSPFEGRLFTAARRFIPGYTLIRQAAKIYVLLPTLLALGATAALAALHHALPRRAFLVLILAVAAGFAGGYGAQTGPLLSRVSDTQPTYAALARHAREHGGEPHALVIPLWPGDSHQSSVYQYFASLYRIRMVNGYRPFVPKEYIEDIFHGFRSVNHGNLNGEQIDNLLARGIEYVVFHENLFPEKVSPFPAAVTLRQLLGNPRITLLHHEGSVWAFHLEQAAATHAAPAAPCDTAFPARTFEAERLPSRGAAASPEAAASGGRCLELGEGATCRTKPLFAPALPGLCWRLRVRGEGALQLASVTGTNQHEAVAISVNARAWHWIEAPLPAFDGSMDVAVRAEAVRGTVAIDLIQLAAGAWSTPPPGESLTLPAACFFHAGETDPRSNTVRFVPGRDRADLVLYGPKLPLEPGPYSFTCAFASTAERGTVLGHWIIACPEGSEVGRLPVVAGEPASTNLAIPSNLPLLCAFRYEGTGEVRLDALSITRAGP